MAEPYSIELRERVVRTYETGEGSYPEVAERFAIGEATVKRWVSLMRKRGTVGPERKGGGTPSSITLADVEALLVKLKDPTAGELAAGFNRGRRGRARIHVSSMKRALYRYGYVVKKNADGRWKVCGRTSSPNGQHS
jgi:transposase